MEIDILVVGSGGAGMVAAIRAAELGKKVVVLTKKYAPQAQTSMAQGGINAAIDPQDSIENHIADTLKAGAGLCSEEMVKLLCSQALDAIGWLDFLGMPFSRKGDKIAQRRLGGASFARACYAQDFTGLKLLHTLYDRAIALGVTFLEEKFLLNFLVEDERCVGVSVFDIPTGEVEQILASATIIATGGFAKIYGPFSTNGYGSYGEGLAAAMRAGVVLSDLEFVQFHPTALKKSALLISEAARGAGAKLVNSKGEQFVNELATRDEVARAIFEELQKGEVYLDMRSIDEEILKKELPQEITLAKRYEGIDPTKELLPIRPAAHYTMGGIDVDFNMQSSLKGLYAVGECANAKVHGANRLGGNSLLELVVFGKIAAEAAAKEKIEPQKKEYERTKIDRNFLKAIFAFPNQIDFLERQEFLSKVLYHNCGIVREELPMKGVLSVIRQHQRELSFMGLKDKSPLYNTELVSFLEYGNIVELSEAMVVAAISRNESRGSHFRKDYPKKDDEKYLAHTLVWKEDGVLCADFKPIK